MVTIKEFKSNLPNGRFYAYRDGTLLRTCKTAADALVFCTGCSIQEAIDTLNDCDGDIEQAIASINRTRDQRVFGN